MTAPAPEPFDEVEPSSDDAAITTRVTAIGVAEVVGTGMRWLQERFDAEAAASSSGVIQWDITDGDERHRWQLVVADGACNLIAVDADGAGDDGQPRLRPDVTLAASPAEFVRLVAGVAGLMERFTAGHVLVAGNLPLARATASWFPR